jgi:hypothetical protein
MTSKGKATFRLPTVRITVSEKADLGGKAQIISLKHLNFSVIIEK